MLFNYGIEGRSYNMVDGKPEFTELITIILTVWTMPWPRGNTSSSVARIFTMRFAMPDAQIEASWASISTWL